MEVAWLIEQPGNTGSPLYWCGLTMSFEGSGGGHNVWSSNSLHAIRFSREIDARMMAECLPSHSGIAVEHAWMRPIQCEP